MNIPDKAASSGTGHIVLTIPSLLVPKAYFLFTGCLVSLTSWKDGLTARKDWFTGYAGVLTPLTTAPPVPCIGGPLQRGCCTVLYPALQWLRGGLRYLTGVATGPASSVLELVHCHYPPFVISMLHEALCLVRSKGAPVP